MQERDEARKVVRDTLWMAGRYADGRRSYAVGLYNDALAIAERSGYAEGAKPARDGMFDAEPETPAQGWQPIESAPKDGTLLLVYRPKHAPPARFGIRTATEWCGPKCCPDAEPTHWMPLPAPPAQPNAGGAPDAEGERRT